MGSGCNQPHTLSCIGDSRTVEFLMAGDAYSGPAQVAGVGNFHGTVPQGKQLAARNIFLFQDLLKSFSFGKFEWIARAPNNITPKKM